MLFPRHFRLAGSLLAIPLAAFIAAGCGSDGTDTATAANTGDTIKVTHAQGEATVPVDPERVIVFDMSVLETIDVIGGGDAVIGVPREGLPTALDSYDRDEVINAGSLFEPDYEAVAAADPELIIIGGRSAEAYKELAKIAPTIDMTGDATDFLGSLSTQVETLGEIFDVEDEAASQLEQVTSKVESVRETASDAGTGLILMSSGGKLSAYGSGSRFGFLHDTLEMKPAREDIKVEGPHGEAASFEYVLEANPDWIFAIDRDSVVGEDSASAREVLDNELVNKTTAGSKDQIVYVDSAAWYITSSGLRSVGVILDEIGEALDA